jgi:hypothetical protein
VPTTLLVLATLVAALSVPTVAGLTAWGLSGGDGEPDNAFVGVLAALVGFGMVYNAVISFRALFLGMPDWAWFAMWVSPGAAFVGILLAGSELRGEPARSYLVAIALPLSMCIPAVLVWLARSPG